LFQNAAYGIFALEHGRGWLLQHLGLFRLSQHDGEHKMLWLMIGGYKDFARRGITSALYSDYIASISVRVIAAFAFSTIVAASAWVSSSVRSSACAPAMTTGASFQSYCNRGSGHILICSSSVSTS